MEESSPPITEPPAPSPEENLRPETLPPARRDTSHLESPVPPFLRRGSVPLLPPLPASPVESERVMVTGSSFSRVWSQPSPQDSGACVGAPAGSARPRTPARSLRSPAPPAAEARAPSPQPRPARAPGPRSSAPSFRRRSSSSRLRGSGRLSRSPPHLPSILLDRASSLHLSHHSFTF